MVRDFVRAAQQVLSLLAIVAGGGFVIVIAILVKKRFVDGNPDVHFLRDLGTVFLNQNVLTVVLPAVWLFFLGLSGNNVAERSNGSLWKGMILAAPLGLVLFCLLLQVLYWSEAPLLPAPMTCLAATIGALVPFAMGFGQAKGL
jgi:hypothetical protein